MLPDNQIGTGQRRLLGGDIDIEIGIELIEGAYLSTLASLLFKHRLFACECCG
jgi:hypothetical protein